VYKNLTILLRELSDNNIHLQFPLYHKLLFKSLLCSQIIEIRAKFAKPYSAARILRTLHDFLMRAHTLRVSAKETRAIYICALSSLSNVQHHTSAFTSSSSLTSSTTQTLSSLLSRLRCERVWHRQLTTHHPRFLGLCLIIRHKTLLMQGLGRNRLPQPI
jgi:hypothetical protein